MLIRSRVDAIFLNKFSVEKIIELGIKKHHIINGAN
jgi:hypothetical protein